MHELLAYLTSYLSLSIMSTPSGKSAKMSFKSFLPYIHIVLDTMYKLTSFI
jgi:hypothetical protein